MVIALLVLIGAFVATAAVFLVLAWIVAVGVVLIGQRRGARAEYRSRLGGTMAGEYVFVDEWDVDAPQEAVFEALADARTYPTWWKPTYKDVEADGPPAVGCASRQKFKAKLPYTLSTVSTIVRLDPPREIEAHVVGDLRGTGVWTLTPADGKVHVRFDWRVHADRALLRTLTPLVRPLFRWNHNLAIKRAMAGLEPYAQSHRQAPRSP